MKNRVNISRLIEEKYKDDTFSFKQLNEMIDSVLQEGLPYWQGKVDTENLEEDPKQGIKIANAVNGNSVPINGPATGAPRHEIPDTRDKNLIPAWKIAEGGEDTVPKGLQLQRENVKQVRIPDLYSLMTNKKLMQTGTNERELINQIMSNLGASQDDWVQRIDALIKYTKFMQTPQAGTTKKDITQMISSLMMLNVLKKLSFFTEQPGKQFEYIFSPFIHPDAVPAGDEATEIADIKGVQGNFSLKFLTSESPTIRGSYDNLTIKTLKQDSWYVDYVVVKVVSNGVIQFGRVGVTANKQVLAAKGYELIGGERYVLYQKGKGGQGTTAAGEPAFIYLALAEGEKIGQKGVGLQQVMAGEQTVKIGNVNVSVLSNTLNKDLSNLNALATEYKDALMKKDKDKLEKAKNRINNILKTYKIPEQDNPLPFLVGSEGQKGFIQQIQDANSLSREILKGRATGETPSFTNEAVSKKQQSDPEQQNKDNKEKSDKSQFSIDVSRIWPKLVVKMLNLGDPETYNQVQIEFSDSLGKMYADALANLDLLTENITKYFGTAGGENQQAGQDALKNAEAVKENLSGIVKA